MQSNNLIASVLFALLLTLSLSCADKPTEPELTAEDVAHIVADELARMAEAEKNASTPSSDCCNRAQVYGLSAYPNKTQKLLRIGICSR